MNSAKKTMSTLQNPNERKAKQDAINLDNNKIKQLKSLQDSQKKAEEEKKKNDLLNKQKSQQQNNTQTNTQINQQINQQTNPQTNQQIQEDMLPNKPQIKKFQTQPISQSQNQPISNKITHIVKFDTKTKNPFQVKFSERGFSVDDTRLSFELLETAISKNFNITLNGGQGLVLDAVKMQKIMKYKDRF